MRVVACFSAWRFRCSSRQDSASVDLVQCREVFLTDIGRLSAASTCISCYNCTEFIPAPVATTVAPTDGSTADGDSGRSASCDGGAFVVTTVLLTSTIAALVAAIGALLLKVKRLRRERSPRPPYSVAERVATISKASLREVREPVVPMLFDPAAEKFSDVQSPHLLFRRERQPFDLNFEPIDEIADSSV